MKKWKLHYAIFGAFRASVSLAGLAPVAELALPVFAVTCGNVGGGKDLHDKMTAAQMEDAIRAKLESGDYAGYAGTSRVAYVDFEAMEFYGWPREKIVQAYRACLAVAPEFDWGMYSYPKQDLFKTVPGDLAAVRTLNDGYSYLANLVRVKIPDFYMVVSTAADSEAAAQVNIEETFRTFRDSAYQRTIPQIWPMVNPGPTAVSAAVFMAQAKRLYALGIRELIIWGQADNAPDAAALQAAIDGWEADFLAEYGGEDLTPVVRGAVSEAIDPPAADTDVWGAQGWAPSAGMKWTKYTVSYADLAVAATSTNIILAEAPEGTVLHAACIKPTEEFAGGAISDLTLWVKFTGASETLGTTIVALAPGNTVGRIQFAQDDAGSLLDYAAFGGSRKIRLYAEDSSANLDDLTQGSADIWILTSTLP